MQSSKYKDDDLLSREDIAAYMGVNMTQLASWLSDGYKGVIKPSEGTGGPHSKYYYKFYDVKKFEEYVITHKPKWKKRKSHKKDKSKIIKPVKKQKLSALGQELMQTKANIKSNIVELHKSLKQKENALLELEFLIKQLEEKNLL